MTPPEDVRDVLNTLRGEYHREAALSAERLHHEWDGVWQAVTRYVANNVLEGGSGPFFAKKKRPDNVSGYSPAHPGTSGRRLSSRPVRPGGPAIAADAGRGRGTHEASGCVCAPRSLTRWETVTEAWRGGEETVAGAHQPGFLSFVQSLLSPVPPGMAEIGVTRRPSRVGKVAANRCTPPAWFSFRNGP